ncbi:hypothetical protein Tco_0008498 [Tanacetum coccineum]
MSPGVRAMIWRRRMGRGGGRGGLGEGHTIVNRAVGSGVVVGLTGGAERMSAGVTAEIRHVLIGQLQRFAVPEKSSHIVNESTLPTYETASCRERRMKLLEHTAIRRTARKAKTLMKLGDHNTHILRDE